MQTRVRMDVFVEKGLLMRSADLDVIIMCRRRSKRVKVLCIIEHTYIYCSAERLSANGQGCLVHVVYVFVHARAPLFSCV